VTAVASAGEFEAALEASSAGGASELSWPLPLVTVPDSPVFRETATDRDGASWSSRVGRRLAVSDAATLATSAAVGLLAWDLGGPAVAPSSWIPIKSAVLLCVLAAGWFWALGLFRTRHVSVLGGGSREFARIGSATITAFGVLAVVSIVFGFPVDRGLFLPALIIGSAGLFVGRFGWRKWIGGQRARGACVTTVLALGGTRQIAELASALRLGGISGYRIVGACSDDDGPAIRLVSTNGDPVDSAPSESVPVLGMAHQALEIAQRLGVVSVVIADGSGLDAAEVKEISRGLHEVGIGVLHLPAAVDVSTARVDVQSVAGRQFLHIAPPTYAGASGLTKRLMDFIGSSLLILLLSPVLAGIAVAIKLTSPGPVFFRQERIGLRERSFRMIKFRSMSCDAEARLAEIRDAQDMGNTVMFKARNDPRVTKVGRVLRRFSLDELPQLFNVWKSEMSLVGPRPPLPSEVACYGDIHRRRFLVKPGMTGLWQVSGRSELDWSETTRLDQYYVDNWSATSDVAILCRTFKAATKGV
jgi:exopolysaccharide biosynthesis polyprenyl glycosylphosphotransferase